ncbi:MAG: hypothetical protein HKN25_16370 [Pyrinomonadaceae bacterium]|nr:hypothetical protein [Pyrinomonadaceae bacterium]
MRSQAKNANRIGRLSIFVFLSVFVSFLAFSASDISAQPPAVDDRPKNLVPPPLIVLSKDEKKKLRATVRIKNRTKLALALMNARLTRSEMLTKDQKHSLTLEQLGRFDAVMRDTMRYFARIESRRGALKNLKLFEMTLRKFIPRLELIRRETPDRYGYHVKRLIKDVRKARTKAIAPMFGDTVLPEGSK